MINRNQIAILKDTCDSFEAFYADEIRKRGIEVIDSGGMWRGILAPDRKYHPLKVISIASKLRPRLAKKKLILTFGVNRSDIYTIQLAKQKDCKVAAWLWNTVDDSVARRVDLLRRQDNFKCFTFDPGDAERYGLDLVHQFYFFSKDTHGRVTERIASRSAFFVGINKGRSRELSALAAHLETCGCACDFHIIADSDKDETLKKSWVQKDFMPYSDVIKHIADDLLTIDLMKQGQAGITVRPLEALRYGRKIITNNQALLNPEKWNPRNVFLVGNGSIDDVALTRFLENPYDTSKDNHFKRMYSFEDWLEQIVSKSLGGASIDWSH